MSKLLIATLLGILLLPGLLAADEIKLSGEMWNRWTVEQGKAPGDSSDAILRNNLSLERGYLGLEAKFSETIKGRFTVDIYSTDLIKDGAGLKVKYAYVDFANLIPVPDLTLTAGLQKVYFGTIYDWNYTLIGKAPSDEFKVANSTDYGLSLNGFIPGGWGEYALGVYNGEGYKNYGANLKDNIEPSYLANLRLTPLPGITVGASAMTNANERKVLLATAANNNSYNTQLLLDGLLRAAYGPLDLWVEYMRKDVAYPNALAKNYVAQSFSVIPIVKLNSLLGADIDLVGRYDRWDETANTANKNLRTDITGGVNFNFNHDESANPKMQVQINYIQKSYDAAQSAASYANGLKDTRTLMLQFKWRFTNTLKA